MIQRGLSGVVALWLGMYLTGSVPGSLLGIAAAWAIVLVTYSLSAVDGSRRALAAGGPQASSMSCDGNGCLLSYYSPRHWASS